MRKQKALLSWLLPQLGFQDSAVLKCQAEGTPTSGREETVGQVLKLPVTFSSQFPLLFRFHVHEASGRELECSLTLLGCPQPPSLPGSAPLHV